MKKPYKTIIILLILSFMNGRRSAGEDVVGRVKALREKGSYSESVKLALSELSRTTDAKQRASFTRDLCYAYHGMGDYKKNVKCLDQLYGQTTDARLKQETLNMKGFVLEEMGRTSEAEEVFKKIIDDFPESGRAKSLRSQMDKDGSLLQLYRYSYLQPVIFRFLQYEKDQGIDSARVRGWSPFICALFLGAVFFMACVIVIPTGAALKVLPSDGAAIMLKSAGLFLLVQLFAAFRINREIAFYFLIGIPIMLLIFNKHINSLKEKNAVTSIMKVVFVIIIGSAVYFAFLLAVGKCISPFLVFVTSNGVGGISRFFPYELNSVLTRGSIIALNFFLAAVFEELFFRGIIFRLLSRKNLLFGAITSALLFSISYTGNPLQSFIVFILGVISALVYRASGMKIAAPIIFRFIFFLPFIR